LFIGLAVAGANARIVPVAIDHFLNWLRARGQSPTFARLEEFAALVGALRCCPGLASQGSLGPRASEGYGLTIPVSANAYEDWLISLGRAPEQLLLDAYALFCVEAWTDLPDPAVMALSPRGPV
jgi:hypothetical protein